MSRQKLCESPVLRPARLTSRLVVLCAVVLGLLLTNVNIAHAFSIGARATWEILAVTPNPPFDPIFTVSEIFSCPGPACRSAVSRYAVVGTSQAAIPAGFQYDYEATSSEFLIDFSAFGKGGLLARLRAFRSGDEGWFEAVSCGPPTESCVATIAPLQLQPPGGPDPRFTYVSVGEFDITRGGNLNQGSGFLPFFLPVGRDNGIGASLQVTAGARRPETFCVDHPETCAAETNAVFTLIASPPPGASFLEPVPEPATLLLVGTTAAGLGLARWRQRRRQQQS